jgi:hypothetical protein
MSGAITIGASGRIATLARTARLRGKNLNVANAYGRGRGRFVNGIDRP